MSEVLQANIFFIIASMATVVFCVFVCMILYQIYKIIRTIRSIIERIDNASAVVGQDVSELRAFVAHGGSWFSKILQLMVGEVGEPSPRRRRKKTTT